MKIYIHLLNPIAIELCQCFFRDITMHEIVTEYSSGYDLYVMMGGKITAESLKIIGKPEEIWIAVSVYSDPNLDLSRFSYILYTDTIGFNNTERLHRVPDIHVLSSSQSKNEVKSIGIYTPSHESIVEPKLKKLQRRLKHRHITIDIITFDEIEKCNVVITNDPTALIKALCMNLRTIVLLDDPYTHRLIRELNIPRDHLVPFRDTDNTYNLSVSDILDTIDVVQTIDISEYVHRGRVSYGRFWTESNKVLRYLEYIFPKNEIGLEVRKLGINPPRKTYKLPLDRIDNISKHYPHLTEMFHHLAPYSKENGYYLDLNVNHTFEKGSIHIPYTMEWIGFVHAPFKFGSDRLFKKSLESCKGLFCFNPDIQTELENYLDGSKIPVWFLEFPIHTTFTFEKDEIHVGDNDEYQINACIVHRKAFFTTEFDEALRLLGSDYPGYFSDAKERAMIEYLENIKVTKFTYDTFIRKFHNLLS